MKAIVLLVLFGLISFAVSAPVVTPTNCSCLAFRLDDIQDFYLSGVQKTIMGIFKEQGVPLTIGIIANSFGTDLSLVNTIKTSIGDPGWVLEVGSHGYSHEDFRNFSLNDQNNLLAQSKQKIQTMLYPNLPDNSIKTFIPPFDVFNDDTLTALKNQGFKYMSSQITIDTNRPYPLYGQDLYRFPIGAATTDLTASPQLVGVTHDATWKDVKLQLATAGYSVVMIHPQEFGTFSGTTTTDVANETMINELRALLKEAKDSGLRLVPISGVNVDSYINGGTSAQTSSGTTMPSTSTTTRVTTATGVATASTTGVASSTTGNPSKPDNLSSNAPAMFSGCFLAIVALVMTYFF